MQDLQGQTGPGCVFSWQGAVGRSVWLGTPRLPEAGPKSTLATRTQPCPHVHPPTHTHTCSYHRSKVGSGQMTRLQGSVCRREGKLCPRPVWFLRPAQDHKGAVQQSAADYTERAARYTAANVHTGAHTARRAHRHVLARCRSMTGR